MSLSTAQPAGVAKERDTREGEEQHKHRQERRLQLDLLWEALLCGTLRTRFRSGFLGRFRIVQTSANPWRSRALAKRNKSQTVLSAGFRSRLVSLCLGFPEHRDIQPLSCQNLLLEPLTSRCAGCAGQGKLSGVHGMARARENSGGMSPPGQGGAEGRVPRGTEHCQHMEGTQPRCRASDGNSSLDGAL